MFIAKTSRKLNPTLQQPWEVEIMHMVCGDQHVTLIDLESWIITSLWSTLYGYVLRSNAEEPNCYTALNYQKSLAIEPVFYFGGPGGGLFCPWEVKTTRFIDANNFLAIKSIKVFFFPTKRSTILLYKEAKTLQIQLAQLVKNLLSNERYRIQTPLHQKSINVLVW